MIPIGPIPHVDPAIATHADLLHFSAGCGKTAFHGEENHLRRDYPGNAVYNACATGKYFIHRIKYTDPALLHFAKSMGLTLVDVPQGYTRCTTLPVDEDAIITADRGVAAPCRRAGLTVLEISPGHVSLPGYPYGFLGGAAGRVGNEILFHGDLSTHPDGPAIGRFIQGRGLTCVDFSDARRFPGLSGVPLTDIGSIIEEP